MLSRITIELDFATGKPYIRVINNKQSDDVKDKIISFFREQFGHSSSWCRVKFDDTAVSGNFLLEIHPIPPNELATEVELITNSVKSSKPSPLPL